MKTITTERNSNSAFMTPSYSSSIGYSFIFNSVRLTPFYLSFSHPVNCHMNIIVLIYKLFSRCCPPYVANLVMAIVVNSIKRMFFGWLSTNLFKEILKSFKSKLNTTASVIFVSFLISVTTSKFCIMKCTVFWTNIIMAFAMFRINFFYPITMVASTGISRTVSQCCAFCNYLISTITQTIPFTLTSIRENKQSPIFFIRYVFNIRSIRNLLRINFINKNRFHRNKYNTIYSIIR